MILPRLIEVDDRSRIGQCRRVVKALGGELGFEEADRERMGIAVTEGASNILRHAERGYCLLQLSNPGEPPRLTVLFWDTGPGIRDVSKSMQDGFSSAEGQGIGLGAMARLADRFDLYSVPKCGLVVSMVFESDAGNAGKMAGRSQSGDAFGTAIPMPEESVSGDAWAISEVGGNVKAMLVDGLGHGVKAAEAADLAVETFEKVSGEDGDAIVGHLNEALKKTRGAVVAVAEIDASASLVRYTGIGNISACLASPSGSSRLTSLSGTVGYQIRSVRSFEYPWSEESMIILHSDGLRSRWEFDGHSGLLFKPAATVVGTLLSLYRKRTDDCSVLCLKAKAAGL